MNEAELSHWNIIARQSPRLELSAAVAKRRILREWDEESKTWTDYDRYEGFCLSLNWGRFDANGGIEAQLEAFVGREFAALDALRLGRAEQTLAFILQSLETVYRSLHEASLMRRSMACFEEMLDRVWNNRQTIIVTHG